jgi:predicted HTH transcriptional regulator
MSWAKNELEHVGYLVGVKDPDIQYSYAQSVVNGMLHLRDALFEMVKDPKYKQQRTELLRTHDKVVRVVKYLIKDFKVDLGEIKRFNSRHVLSDLSYLKGSGTRKARKTRGTRKSRK